jgi:hypothetical protein
MDARLQLSLQGTFSRRNLRRSQAKIYVDLRLLKARQHTLHCQTRYNLALAAQDRNIKQNVSDSLKPILLIAKSVIPEIRLSFTENE